MNFLKWYSKILLSISVAIVFIDWVNMPDDVVAFMAIVLYSPAVVYLWKLK